MDLLYTHLVRKPFKAIALPVNPLQRCLARLSVGILNFFVGNFSLLSWTHLALAIATYWAYYSHCDYHLLKASIKALLYIRIICFTYC